MKIILVLSVLAVAVYSKRIPPAIVDSWRKLVSPYEDKCIEESQVDATLAKNVFTKDQMPNEVHFRCYFKCLDTNLGFYLPNGNHNKQKMIDDIDHVTAKIADACIDPFQNEPNPCTKSFKTAHCIVDMNSID